MWTTYWVLFYVKDLPGTVAAFVLSLFMHALDLHNVWAFDTHHEYFTHIMSTLIKDGWGMDPEKSPHFHKCE